MRTIYFSPSVGSFYLSDVHPVIPLDRIEVSESDHAEMMKAVTLGKSISVNSDGKIFASDPLPEPRDSELERVKSDLRMKRRPILDALTGIAGRAERAGNSGVADEADALANQLLGITDDAALNAAGSYEEMHAAGLSAFRSISSGVSPELVSAFRHIFAEL